MNDEDTKFWEDVLELTGKPQWASLVEDLEVSRQGLEDKMLRASSWDEFLETRGQVRSYNHILNLRDLAKRQLGIEDEDSV